MSSAPEPCAAASTDQNTFSQQVAPQQHSGPSAGKVILGAVVGAASVAATAALTGGASIPVGLAVGAAYGAANTLATGMITATVSAPLGAPPRTTQPPSRHDTQPSYSPAGNGSSSSGGTQPPAQIEQPHPAEKPAPPLAVAPASAPPAKAPPASAPTKLPCPASWDPDRAWYLENGFQVKESDTCKTIVTGLKPFVREWLVYLKQEADLKTLVITGAAERSGHTTSGKGFGHADGYKVDLRPSDKLADYINRNFTRCEKDRAGAHGGPRWTGVWKDPQTNKEYDVDIVREKAGGDHFDIQVKPKGEGTSAACKPK